MNNLLESVKRIFKNKSIVTILGVIIILILLYIGYSTQINNAVKPVPVPVATQTIQPRTEITNDMVKVVDMPNASVTENVYTSKKTVVGKYSNVNSVIPEGSMFYKETVILKDELPDIAFIKLKAGEVPYNFKVTMESTYGNSIFPGNKIDMYMKVGDGKTEKIMIGKLLSNIEVLAVKDASGRAVFENTSESRTPSMLIFGLSQTNNLLLKKASYMGNLGVELYPVPQGTSITTPDTVEVSTQELVDYITAHSVDIQIDETIAAEEVDPLAPTATETGGVDNKVTITYPAGCGTTYTCTYIKDSEKIKTVSNNKTSVTVKYNGAGKLIATVTEKDGTSHTLNTDIPFTNSTTEQAS